MMRRKAGHKAMVVLNENLLDDVDVEEVLDDDGRDDIDLLFDSDYAILLTIDVSDVPDLMPNCKSLERLMKDVSETIYMNDAVEQLTTRFVVYNAQRLNIMKPLKDRNITRDKPFNYYDGKALVKNAYGIFGIKCSFKRINDVQRLLYAVFSTGFRLNELSGIDLYGMNVIDIHKISIDNDMALNAFSGIVRNVYEWNAVDDGNLLAMQPDNVSDFYMKLLKPDRNRSDKVRDYVSTVEVEKRLQMFWDGEYKRTSVCSVVVKQSKECGLSIVEFGDYYNIYDNERKKIISPKMWFSNIYDFSEGVAAVEIGGTGWVFIDRTGKIVVKQLFDCIESHFKDGYALISSRDGTLMKVFNIINRDFELVLPKWCKEIDMDFMEKLIYVNYVDSFCNVIRKSDMKFLFPDNYVTTVFRGDYTSLYRNYSSKGIVSCRVKNVDDKFNLVDENGNVIYDDWKDEILPFIYGCAVVYDKGETDFIGYDGKKRINDKTIEPDAGGFRGERIRVKKRFAGEYMYNYMDVDGNKILSYWLPYLSLEPCGEYCGVFNYSPDGKGFLTYGVDFHGNIYNSARNEINIEDIGISYAKE